MSKIFESLKNIALKDFNSGALSGSAGYSKIKVKGVLLACECKKAAGSTNRSHIRFNWFVDGNKVSFSDLTKVL